MIVKTIRGHDYVFGSGVIALTEHTPATAHLKDGICMKRQQTDAHERGDSNEETVKGGFFPYILNFCKTVSLI